MVYVSDEKFARQLNLEREMEENSAAKLENIFQKAELSGTEIGTPYGSLLLKQGVSKLSEAITLFITTSVLNKGRLPIAAKLLKEFPNINAVAFLALRHVINNITKQQSLTKVALAIGTTLEKEALLISFKKENPDLYKNVTTLVKTKTEHSRFAALNVAMNRNNIGKEKWTVNERLQLGIKLIDLIILSTKYIDILSEQENPYKKTNYIVPTEECLRLINSYKKNFILNPDYLPTIIPPKEWTTPFDGGYYSKIKPLWLIKARFNPKNYLEELNNRISQMPTVYKAINAIQNTPYRINKRVYNLMANLWESGKEYKIIPKGKDTSLPACPCCGEVPENNCSFRKHSCFLKEKNAHLFKQWLKEVTVIRKENTSTASKKIQLSKILYLADKFKDEDSIYFPMQLDFRGRVYPVPGFLQPQGSDWSKGLLEFAKGEPLEDFNAVRWLAIHGANLYGEDKISLDDRFLWVLENEKKIISVASDPYNNHWWMAADKPFQFLGFCYEWTDYVKSCEQGTIFLSHIPVAMDGTCNGLQIFSLLLRDEVGGKATNLIPSPTPQDIYNLVADKVKEKLTDKISKGEAVYKKNSDTLLYNEKDIAPLLLELGIDRKATKRQVMTLPYGATFASCKDYTLEWVKSKKESMPTSKLFSDNGKYFHGAIFLAQLIWDAIHETVIAAKFAMDYLRTLASVITKEQLPVTWTTPVGLIILQAYKETRSRRVKCELGSGLVFANIKESGTRLDLTEQKNGISPNFIHSLDAAAMMMTISIALDKGIHSFAMVHDSYATHATHAEKLSESLRQGFIAMFQEDLLLKFRNEIVAVLTPNQIEELPPLPPTGSLDIKGLEHSEYFFA